MVNCVCGKEFATDAGLKQHLRRRFCHNRPNAGDATASTNQCTHCPREFKTYPGLRQHVRLSHPDEYNNDLERQAENPISFRNNAWSEVEVIAMAKHELKFEGKFINKHLHGIFPYRTLEAIKSKRLTQDYKDLIVSLKTEGAMVNEDVGEELEREAEQPVPEPEIELVEETLLRPGSPDLGVATAIPSDEPDNLPSTSSSVNISICPQSPSTQPIIAVDPVREYLTSYFEATEGWTDEDRALYDLVRRSSVKNSKHVVLHELEKWLTLILSQLNIRSQNNNRANVHPRANNKRGDGGRYRRGANRAHLYKIAQTMYNKNRTKLAEMIFDGKPLNEAEAGPSIEEIQSRYKDLFSTESPPDNHPILDYKDHDIETFAPFTEDEIKRGLVEMKSPAAGPDHVKLHHLKRLPCRRLVMLFNCMAIYGVIPSTLKANRTVLLPKEGQPSLVDSWRPITISSVILRLFTRLIGHRLARLPFHSHQRGFRKVDGVLANTLTLEAVLRKRRATGRPVSVVSLDLRKAFDTVSHNSILRALRRFKVDERLIRLVGDMYTGSFTTITKGGKTTCPLDLKIGVKQGDPLSPTLFNMVLDELIGKLEEKPGGLSISESLEVKILGYADDLILLDNDHRGASKLLKEAVQFFQERGLSLNTKKCAALSLGVVPGKKQLYAHTRNLFFVGGIAIPQLSPGDFFKYLGARYDFTGQARPRFDTIKSMVTRLKASPLKPSQKVELLRTNLVPRLLSLLQTTRVTLSALKDADRFMRKSVREMLHMNRTSPDAYIHAPVREGGLGIISLRAHVPAIMRRRMTNLAVTADPLTAAVLAMPAATKLYDRLLRWTEGNGGNTNNISKEWSRRLQESYSGNGLRQGSSDGASGSWVRNPPQFWSGADYVNAVLLRGNLLPTKGIPSNPPHERLCRAGCRKTESLSHVLQGCPLTHWHRIQRHDRISGRLRKIAEDKGWLVEEEQRLRLADGSLRKPDLMFFKGNTIVVCDVTIAWEGPNPLAMAYDQKVAYYSQQPVLDEINRLYPERNVVVLALAIGARGTWCRRNDELAEALSLSRAEKTSLINNTINGSVIIYKEFMRTISARATGHR